MVIIDKGNIPVPGTEIFLNYGNSTNFVGDAAVREIGCELCGQRRIIWWQKRSKILRLGLEKDRNGCKMQLEELSRMVKLLSKMLKN